MALDLCSDDDLCLCLTLGKYTLYTIWSWISHPQGIIMIEVMIEISLVEYGLQQPMHVHLVLTQPPPFKKGKRKKRKMREAHLRFGSETSFLWSRVFANIFKV